MAAFDRIYNESDMVKGHLGPRICGVSCSAPSRGTSSDAHLCRFDSSGTAVDLQWVRKENKVEVKKEEKKKQKKDKSICIRIRSVFRVACNLSRTKILLPDKRRTTQSFN